MKNAPITYKSNESNKSNIYSIIATPSFGFYDNVTQTKPSQFLSLSQVAERINAPFSKEKSRLPLIVPHNGAAKTQEAAATAGFGFAVVDFDGVEKPIQAALDDLRTLGHKGALLYFTTSSHGSTVDKNGKPKHPNHYKILIPFAHPVDASTYHDVSTGISLLFGADLAQNRVQQGFYAPNSQTAGKPYEGNSICLDGEKLSQSSPFFQTAIRRYTEWQAEKIAVARAATPKPKPIPPSGNVGVGVGANIIELINSAYDLPGLLTAHGHTPRGKGWLSPHSTTKTAGGYILDGGRFYSHHGDTCPLSSLNSNGHSLDAADVLCLLEYNGNYADMIADQAKKIDPDAQKQRQRAFRKTQERLTVTDVETGEVYTPEPSGDAKRICHDFALAVIELLQLSLTPSDVMAQLELDAHAVDRIINETMRNSGRKDELLVLTKSEILNNHAKRDAWAHIIYNYGAPYNQKALDEMREQFCLANRISPDVPATRPAYQALAKKINHLLQSPIYWHIEQHNQRSEVSYRVDMFAKSRFVEMQERCAAFTLTHRPIAARSGQAITNYSQAIIDDYTKHFPEFNEVLEFLVMARFAPDRKKAYLWLHAPSDWGKGFFKSALRNMGIMAELSVKEVETMFEGKPVGKDPDDFKRALCVVFDEFKAVKSELKQLENTITLTPKFKMASEVEVFSKLFLSAENVSSLVGVSGIEDQLANRFSCIIGKGEIHTRPLFNKIGSGEYLRHVTGYAQAKINKLIETMRSQGRTKAEKTAEVFINTFHATHGIDKLGQRLSESLVELAEEFLAHLVHEWQTDFATQQLFKNASEELCLRNGGKVLADWLEQNADPSELGTLKFKRSEILALISEDGTGKSKVIYNPKKGMRHKAILLRPLHPQRLPEPVVFDDENPFANLTA